MTHLATLPTLRYTNSFIYRGGLSNGRLNAKHPSLAGVRSNSQSVRESQLTSNFINAFGRKIVGALFVASPRSVTQIYWTSQVVFTFAYRLLIQTMLTVIFAYEQIFCFGLLIGEKSGII